jgi:UTP--glucose-1-phosphate uridylyltransferase
MSSDAVHFSQQFQPFAARMKAEGLPDIFIRTFARYYEQLAAGMTGLIPEAEIEPVPVLANAETFSDVLRSAGEAAMPRTVVIKLNGGLGTGMGLEKAKSLLMVKEGLSFLDIIARQSIVSAVPLILMDSFSTQTDARTILCRYPELERGLPQTFLQHKAPKINQFDLTPATWPQNPALEWCPPGHGDIYTALVTSGTLAALLANGYEYAFVSNADNLGAVIDQRILGYFASGQIPFMMEVADRTEMDRKGGHLAQYPGGQLILRESAQCPEEDQDAFQDIGRYRYFNTNNLWFHLPTLHQVMQEQGYQLGLPLIRNRKTVDPRDARSTAVYQLETAMGSAIAIFQGAQAIRVGRDRFAPVKTTNELLAVRSDAYELTGDFRVVLRSGRQMHHFVVNLDPRYFKFVSDIDARFPYGAPSLAQCTRFELQGDVCFGRGVICRGEVIIENKREQQMLIPDGTVLEGRHVYS